MAVTEGTSAGFVVASPIADPGGGLVLGIDGRTNAGKFTSPATAIRVTEIGFYSGDTSSSADPIKVGIYTHDAGNNRPGTLVGSGISTWGGGTGWVKVTGLNITISPETTYWIAASSEDVADSVDIDVDSSVGDEIDTRDLEMPATWGTSDSAYNDYIIAIYAVWEAEGISGPKFPGTAADDATVGTKEWTSVDNIKLDDNNLARATTAGFPDPDTPWTSHYLKATNFRFEIPSGATIDGIVATIARKETSGTGTIVDNEVKIVKSNGSIGTENKALGGNWTGSETPTTYGGSDDLWSESWAYTDINDSDFGVVISVDAAEGGGFTTAGVDYITITIYYTAGGAVTYTKTFTADAILVNPRTKTFTIDALLQASLTKTFTIDTLLQKLLTKTFTTDAILVNLRTKTFTADAFLQASFTKTFTADAILVNPRTKTFTADALLQASFTKIFTMDAILEAPSTKTFTVNAIIKAVDQTKTFTADALIRNSFTKTFTADALLQTSKTKTFTTDALLQKSLTKTFTVDAFLSTRHLKTFTIDSILKSPSLSTTKRYIDSVKIDSPKVNLIIDKPSVSNKKLDLNVKSSLDKPLKVNSNLDKPSVINKKLNLEVRTSLDKPLDISSSLDKPNISNKKLDLKVNCEIDKVLIYSLKGDKPKIIVSGV